MRPQAESGFARGISRAKHYMLYFCAQGWIVRGMATKTVIFASQAYDRVFQLVAGNNQLAVFALSWFG